MSRENRVKVPSMRFPAPLVEFLREQGNKHPKGLTGFFEDCLVIGACAHGFKPEYPSPLFDAFAETISSMVAEKLKSKD